MPKSPVSRTKKTTSGLVKSSPLNKQRYSFRSSFGAWWLINQHLPNPDRVLQKRGQTMAVYRELLSDAHLCATLESRESSTLAFEWRIERGDCPVRLHRAIEQWFFSIIERKQSIGDLSRDEITSNLLDVVFWGYQPAELTWDYLGLWLPVNVTPKPPEWFQFFIGQNGAPEIRFISRDQPVNGEAPPDQWTLICPRIKASYENPYGRGVAGRCFWPIVFKRAGIEFWLNFLERFGTPWVKGTIEGNAEPTVMTAFTDELKALVQDAVIAVSGNRNVELLETGNRQGTNDGFKLLCDFMDSQISKTILGHTLSTDVSDKSSYAATKSALTVRSDIQKRDVSLIRSVWQDIINLIFLRNGFLTTPRPKIIPYEPNAVETERATRDEALSRAGVRFSKNYFVRTYHLEETDIEEVIDPSKLQASGFKQKDDSPVIDVDKEGQHARAD